MAYIEHGNGRPWHKRVLIPFWLVQIAFMGINVAAAAISIYLFSSNTVTINTTTSGSDTSNITTYGLGNINANGTTVIFSNSSTSSSVDRTVIIAFYAVILAFALLGILLSFSEIVLFARHHLTPGKYFGFNLFKFLGWTAIFVLGIVSSVVYGGYLWTLIVNILVELTFLGSLIYACVIFHRYRKGERFDGAQGKKYAPSAPLPPMGISNGGLEAMPNQGYVPNQQYPSNNRGGNGSYA